ncbi:MAG: carbohydrate kinase family protein [Chloroflexota bacterium]|nr:carbohydrate kinase family protein [Chloroflexota bacterium]
MNVVVTGSIAYDYLMTFPGRFAEHILPDQIQRLSVSFLVDDMQKQRGGCAANIAYNLALLGERPRLMGTVGQDFAAYRAWLEGRGVDTSLVRTEEDLFTASFFVSTDQDGNQIANFYTGAMARARELSLQTLRDNRIDLVVISPNDPEAMVKYAAECQALSIPYLYDPSQQIVRLSGDELRQGLQGATLLVVNEYEFEMLREKTALSATQIQAAPGQACIVTRGTEGSRIWTANRTYDIPPAIPPCIDDPTGVGDAYRAGVIKGLALGLPWDLIGRMGSVAATYALEQPGPQNHTYTVADFVSRFRTYFDDAGHLTALHPG